jgi:hypothetical protein
MPRLYTTPRRVGLSQDATYSWKVVMRLPDAGFDSVSVGSGPTGGIDYREALIRALSALEPFCDPWLRRADGKIKPNPGACGVAQSVLVTDPNGVVVYYWSRELAGDILQPPVTPQPIDPPNGPVPPPEPPTPLLVSKRSAVPVVAAGLVGFGLLVLWART